MFVFDLGNHTLVAVTALVQARRPGRTKARGVAVCALLAAAALTACGSDDGRETAIRPSAVATPRPETPIRTAGDKPREGHVNAGTHLATGGSVQVAPRGSTTPPTTSIRDT